MVPSPRSRPPPDARPIRSAVLALAAIVALAVGGACSRAPFPRAAGPFRIVVSVAPLVGLAGALAPQSATVRTVVPIGRSLHGYEPTPGDLAALAQADLVVHVGLGLEPGLERFLAGHPSPRRRVLCFADAVGLAAAADHDHADHEDDGHAHGPVDPHLWLDPSLVRAFVPHLRRAVEEAARNGPGLDEGALARLDEAERSLLAAIDEVDREHRERLAPFAGASIVTHHAAWGRLAERYGLRVAAVVRPIETQEPTPAQIGAAVAALRTEGARTLFVEPQFSDVAARRIADQAGCRLETLDPEGKPDWFILMRSNLDALVRGLAP